METKFEGVQKKCEAFGCGDWFLARYHGMRRCSACRKEKRPYEDGTTNCARGLHKKRHKRLRNVRMGVGRFGQPGWWKHMKKNKEFCTRCKSTKELTLDHILPLADGGKHEPENVQVLCRECHVEKSRAEDRERELRKR